MKATIEFNLPEEQGDYEEFQKGSRALSALRALADQLREYTKYGTDVEPAWQTFRDIFWETCREYEVSLD